MTTSTRTVVTHLSGLRRGELLMSFCSYCTATRFPPGPTCPQCLRVSAPQWRQVAAEGSLWSFATFHKQYDPDFHLPTPYVVAIVELSCGALIYSNIPVSESGGLCVGMRMRGRFVTSEDTTWLQFYRADKET